MSSFSSLQASYDAHGNIILGAHSLSSHAHREHLFEESVQSMPKDHSSKHHFSHRKPKAQWSNTDAPPLRVSFFQPYTSAVCRFFSSVKYWVPRVIREGSLQYCTTQSHARSELHQLLSELKTTPAALAHAKHLFSEHAQTPVTLPCAKRLLHPRTKIGRFFLDSLRFGFTFAFIFALLFSILNYQSFLQIAKAQFALGDTMTTEKALTQVVQGTFGAADKETTNTLSSFSEDGSLALLSALPAVGPAEDRLIIPKIGKNVAIVRPSMDALIHEDWKQFEVDIQDALRHGIVHYPGSAKPGQAGNFFVTGHSSYYPWDPGKYKDVFARLSELDLGDIYSVYYGGDKHVYRVIQKKEVRPTDVSVLDQPMDKRLSTLMTCTPVGTTLRRLIIIAEEIDPNTEEVLKVGEQSTDAMQQRIKNLESLPM
jgi:LPXTG-site transpeptidase (sortase) family protein